MSELIRLSISLEKDLFDRLEKMVKKSRYENRSEFIRDLIRDHMVQEEWENNEEMIGILTLVYNHHMRGISEKLTHSQHHHHEVILSSTHVHLNRDLCAEMVLMRGQAVLIREISDHLRKHKGVLHSALSWSSTGEKLR